MTVENKHLKENKTKIDKIVQESLEIYFNRLGEQKPAEKWRPIEWTSYQRNFIAPSSFVLMGNRKLPQNIRALIKAHSVSRKK